MISTSDPLQFDASNSIGIHLSSFQDAKMRFLRSKGALGAGNGTHFVIDGKPYICQVHVSVRAKNGSSSMADLKRFDHHISATYLSNDSNDRKPCIHGTCWSSLLSTKDFEHAELSSEFNSYRGTVVEDLVTIDKIIEFFRNSQMSGTPRSWIEFCGSDDSLREHIQGQDIYLMFYAINRRTAVMQSENDMIAFTNKFGVHSSNGVHGINWELFAGSYSSFLMVDYWSEFEHSPMGNWFRRWDVISGFALSKVNEDNEIAVIVQKLSPNQRERVLTTCGYGEYV